MSEQFNRNHNADTAVGPSRDPYVGRSISAKSRGKLQADRILGLIINPLAGVGGPAGLAGSDGADVQLTAQKLGASAQAEARAKIALEALPPGTPVLTAAGSMGENMVRAAGLAPEVLYTAGLPTTSADTTSATRALAAAGAGLMLFAGGDGTARDVATGLEQYPDAAVLGIPAGVKMYSSVFGVSPRAAGGLAAEWLADGLPLQEGEVLDIDEAAMRRARVEPYLHGIVSVPYRQGRTQARKSPTPVSEREAAVVAARGAVRRFRPGVRYLLGPGGTMAEAARAVGFEKSPLGVDVVLDGQPLRRAASEQELLDEIAKGPAQAVVTIIGGQGFLLGRGNQQLSARVLRAIGPDPLMVVAPESKLVELHGRPLLVDTGDADMDARLAGFIRVVTSTESSSFYAVHAPEDQE